MMNQLDMAGCHAVVTVDKSVQILDLINQFLPIKDLPTSLKPFKDGQ